MLLYKNVSVTSEPLVVLGIQVPERIVVNNLVYTRKSNIQDGTFGNTWVTKRNAPNVKRLASTLMRYYECSLITNAKLKLRRDKIHIKLLGKQVTVMHETLIEDFLMQSKTVNGIWLLLTVGITSSLIDFTDNRNCSKIYSFQLFVIFLVCVVSLYTTE